MLRKLRNTRYYEFTRVNPDPGDYDLLLDTCRRIGAYLGYCTFYEGDKVRLHGFVVLPHRDEVSNISRAFPNFNFKYVRCFGEKEDEIMTDSNAVLVNKHPFVSIRRRLQYRHVIPDDGDE